MMFDILPDDEHRHHVIVITDRLIATLEKGDIRYHVRAVINSHPSIISTGGIVEGPSKPKEHYLDMESGYDSEPMEYGDRRMTGNPFCDEIGCPLFNSHWQEEVIKNQIRGTLCEKHKNILEESKC